MTKKARHKTQQGAVNYRRGLWAERLCQLRLTLMGYRILAKRYKTPMGEIDLIAARGRALVVIEVKARNTLENAAEAVQPRQQARLYNAAMVFLARNPLYNNHCLRFDLMLFGENLWPRHIRDAWRPDIC